jgi:transposase
MDDATRLFGLEGFRVVSVVPENDDVVRVVVETVEPSAGCPGCGVISTRVKDRPCRQIKDLPVSGRQVALWWRKRRLVCAEPLCDKGSFVERVEAITPRGRLTERLRNRLARAIAVSNRSVADVAREYQVGWHTAHQALIAAAAGWLPEPAPTRVLGIDETRARTVRWVLADAGWRRTDPWLTSFVDADPTRQGPLLGLAPGRSGACVAGWLAAQTPEFRARIEVVVIDPSAPYASGIRLALPGVQIAVDKFHLVLLANQMLTAVRQRVTRELLGRRGRKVDPPWAHRRMLLTAGEQLSHRQLDRLAVVLAADRTDQIGAAWAIKELLRRLLAARDPADIRRRLHDFYAACADADMPETTRLAATIETWWPAVLVFLQLQVTNARTEGFNRTIKQVKRTGCGFRNMANYRRRIMAHIAVTRPALQTAC